MTEETLKKANKIQREIKSLEKNKEMISADFASATVDEYEDAAKVMSIYQNRIDELLIKFDEL